MIGDFVTPPEMGEAFKLSIEHRFLLRGPLDDFEDHSVGPSWPAYASGCRRIPTMIRDKEDGQ